MNILKSPSPCLYVCGGCMYVYFFFQQQSPSRRKGKEFQTQLDQQKFPLSMCACTFLRWFPTYMYYLSFVKENISDLEQQDILYCTNTYYISFPFFCLPLLRSKQVFLLDIWSGPPTIFIWLSLVPLHQKDCFWLRIFDLEMWYGWWVVCLPGRLKIFKLSFFFAYAYVCVYHFIFAVEEGERNPPVALGGEVNFVRCFGYFDKNIIVYRRLGLFDDYGNKCIYSFLFLL